jgi:hypothetical protein
VLLWMVRERVRGVNGPGARSCCSCVLAVYELV